MKTFFEQLDTPGGHMVVCLVVILMGATFWKLGIPKAEDLIVGGSTVIFAAMRGIVKSGAAQ